MTKAIILAAGQGLRLRPLTDQVPKCLVPYQGRPIIDYTLETLGACALTDVVVVGGYRCDVLQAHLRGTGVRVYTNEAYDRTNMLVSLFCAEAELVDDLVISYGDIIYGPDVLAPLVACPDSFATAFDVNWRQLWEARMQDPLLDAETFTLSADGQVLELGHRPTGLDDIQGQYMGLIKMGRDVLPAIRARYHALRAAGADVDHMYMTAFLQSLIDEGMPLRGVPVTGPWMEVDTLDDLKLIRPGLPGARP